LMLYEQCFRQWPAGRQGDLRPVFLRGRRGFLPKTGSFISPFTLRIHTQRHSELPTHFL